MAEAIGARGVMVLLGLGTPLRRTLAATSLAGMGAYALGYPGHSFDEDGELRPLRYLSARPDAVLPHKHFLFAPLAVGAGIYLFT